MGHAPSVAAATSFERLTEESLPATRPSLVVFVAYGAKDAHLWQRLLARLAHAPGLPEVSNLLGWPAGSSGKRHHLRDWISPVSRRAERLRRYLERPPFAAEDPNLDPDIMLVGFGKGCSVIQAYLLRSFSEDNSVRYLRRLRQLVFISPSRTRRYRFLLALTVLITALVAALQLWGHFSPASLALQPSVIMLGFLIAIVSLFFGIISNPSAMELLGLSPVQFDRDDLERQFGDRVLNGDKHKPGTWPVSCQVLKIQDFGEDEESDALRIADALLHPVGHKNVYEVELVEELCVLAPVEGPLPEELEVGSVTMENRASLTRAITFSACNATSAESALSPWELRYQTYAGLLHVSSCSHANRWTPEERSAYQYTHKRHVFRFLPEASQTYTSPATIWNGFSKGHRDSHMHLRADANYNCIRETLDLRPYIEAGWQISKPPEAYFFFGSLPHTNGKERCLDDLGCDCVKTNRALHEGIPLKVEMIEPGLYHWEVRRIRDGGILGFIFDVAPMEKRRDEPRDRT